MNISRFIKALGIVAVLALWLNTSLTTQAARTNEVTGAAAKTAEEIYSSDCAKCHGKDGRAKSMHGKMVHARDFTDAQWQSQTSDEQIIKSIADGKGKMPAFGKKLSQDEIKSLVPIVRGFKGQ